MINLTNQAYWDKGLAVVQKVPTPITAVEVDNQNHRISKAYFEQKSTVDYIGAVQGIPICFDAKETSRESLPIQNIHSHQIEFMEAFEKQRGLSFLLVSFTKKNEYFYLPFGVLKQHYDASRLGGRKSIPYDAFERKLRLYNKHGFFIHYLEAINIILTQSGENK